VTDPLVGEGLDKARRSLAAAERLLADGDSDFAASRAYYAMFYAAEALLLSAGQTFSKHTAVIATFGEKFAHPGIVPLHLHRDLIDAFDLRNVGDYRFGHSVTGADAQHVIGQAREFIDEVVKALE
jgi:uncharacterized protein (UPF0332 family)